MNLRSHRAAPHPIQRRKGGREGLLDSFRACTEATAMSTRTATCAELASHVDILPGEEIEAEPEPVTLFCARRWR